MRDLNWTRSLYIRQALSQIFDHPENLPHLRDINTVTITHSPRHRSTALLLMGWLATQIGWKLATMKPVLFADNEGRAITVKFEESEGPAVSGIALSCDHASFSVQRDANSPFLHADLHLPDGRQYKHLYPAGPDTINGLLNEEMSRASTDRIYLRALDCIEKLL